jgi:hypothetical protein
VLSRRFGVYVAPFETGGAIDVGRDHDGERVYLRRYPVSLTHTAFLTVHSRASFHRDRVEVYGPLNSFGGPQVPHRFIIPSSLPGWRCAAGASARTFARRVRGCTRLHNLSTTCPGNIVSPRGHYDQGSWLLGFHHRYLVNLILISDA